jgi:hypothetical protein
MTLRSFKMSKTLKSHSCQQQWLDLKKIMAPLTNNEKQNSIVIYDNRLFVES